MRNLDPSPCCLGTRLLIRILICWILSAGFGASISLRAAQQPANAKIEYNRDVRPIFSDNCFLCHGPDKNTRKAKLRLDIREEAVAREAFVPGKPDESELVKRIFTANEDDIMPPPDSHKHLTVRQKEILHRWIAQGAEYQPHWAYVIPARPELPAVRNKKWGGSPIDAFVLHALEEQKIKPSRESDRRTLLRRLSLDLIGLPPSAEEVAAFVADRGPNAYEKQVDRLLVSPHFGERMAVPWLDAVRFSDTVGYHGDQNQRIFPYRDYVIASFNRNKPFDKFTIEQLAGDLLPNPTMEQRIATGFNRLNMMTREGGAQPKEYLAKYAADRVRTVGTTWLGSTMGCAECHDHKFDPITSRDFYSMGAFFADVKQWGVYSDYKYTPNADLKGWSNEHPFPPELEVQSEYLKLRAGRIHDQIRQHLAATQARIKTNATQQAAFEKWVASSREFLDRHSDGWVRLELIPPPLAEPVVVATTNISETATNITLKTNAPSAPTVIAEDDWDIRVKLTPKKDEEKVELRLHAGRFASLRMERITGENDEQLEPGSQTRGIRLSALLKRKGRETKMSFYRAEADHKEPRYSNGGELVGVLAGWKPSRKHTNEKQTAVWLFEPPLDARDGDSLVVTLKSTGPLTVRFSASPFGADDPLQAGGSPEFQQALPASLRSGAGPTLAERYLLSTQWDKDAFSQFKKLQADFLECHDGRAYSMITEAQPPYTVRVLPRGNWQNESGAIVKPAVPHFLPQPKVSSDESLTRLDLARWLVSRDNPLTARVFVNRLWKQFFGTGLSAVIDDVGAQGEWPVHPALLDWLAVEFMDSGWNVKHMVKAIVMSSTYRQDSNLRPELHEIDPQNRLLASQNPRRLEAEFVRDNALAVAGLLNLEMGGPSAHPYQPAGYYANLQFPDRDYVADRDDRQYRRGVYMHWQRTFLHPMLANFDAPAREECTANRANSNTPQQALTLLNDPTFVEASRVFAENLLAAKTPSDKSRITLAYQQMLGRTPKSNEASSLVKFLAEQRAHYKAKGDEAKKLLEVGQRPVATGIDVTELAAWTQVCRVMINLHESVTRY